MNKILITGVNGLLGKELVANLLKNKENVIFGISRQNSFFQNENYHHIKLDLQSIDFEQNLPKFIDVIIHLAQSDNFRDFPEKADSIFAVNVHSTQKLLDFALNSGCKKFIFTSSGGVYGYGNENFSEEKNIEMNYDMGYYLSSKIIGELLVRNYSSFFNTIIFRPFFIYGKGQKNRMLIPRLINSIQNELPITLQGRDGIRINPIHVSDAVTAVIKSLNIPISTIYNLGGAEILCLKDICLLIGDILGKKPNFVISDINPNHLIGDICKMKNNLVNPKMIFREGIKKIIE